MKLLLFANEKIYEELNNYYSFFDENNEVIGSDFDRNSYDIIHINSPEFISYALDTEHGYHNITHVIIQKSFFKNTIFLNVLKKFKYICPEIKVIIYMNVPEEYLDYYDLFLSKVAENELGYICLSPENLNYLMENEFNIIQENYILKKISRRQRKEFLLY